MHQPAIYTYMYYIYIYTCIFCASLHVNMWQHNENVLLHHHQETLQSYINTKKLPSACSIHAIAWRLGLLQHIREGGGTSAIDGEGGRGGLWFAAIAPELLSRSLSVSLDLPVRLQRPSKVATLFFSAMCLCSMQKNARAPSARLLQT